MPILAPEPAIYPDTLFTLSAPWRVAHVKSRQEKSLARYLHDYEIPFFLPLTTNEVRTRVAGGKSRVRHSQNPLFPSYVFVRPSEDEILTVKRSGVIANLLEVPSQQILARELEQIWDLQRRGATMVPFPELTTGDPVRIREGAFKGYEGVIVREKGTERLIVQVTMIAQRVAVDLGRQHVAPAGESSKFKVQSSKKS